MNRQKATERIQKEDDSALCKPNGPGGKANAVFRSAAEPKVCAAPVPRFAAGQTFFRKYSRAFSAGGQTAALFYGKERKKRV